jgi:hypothetical protein
METRERVSENVKTNHYRREHAGGEHGTGIHVNDEMKTRTHDSWKREADGSV